MKESPKLFESNTKILVFLLALPILFLLGIEGHRKWLMQDYSSRMKIIQEHPLPEDPDSRQAILDAIEAHQIDSRPVDVAFDVDGDGIQDRFHAGGRSWSIEFSSDGSSSGGTLPTGLSVPHSAGADDIDGDGYQDLWISDPADGTIWILFGDEGAQFSPKQRIIEGWVARGAFVDMDGDGDLDFASDGYSEGSQRGPFWVEMELNEKPIDAPNRLPFE